MFVFIFSGLIQSTSKRSITLTYPALSPFGKLLSYYGCFIKSAEQSAAPLIELSPSDVDRYRALKDGQFALTTALKNSKKRSGGKDLED